MALLLRPTSVNDGSAVNRDKCDHIVENFRGFIPRRRESYFGLICSDPSFSFLGPAFLIKEKSTY